MAEAKEIHIYCDESSQNAHRYMVIGAVACSADGRGKVAPELNDVKAAHGHGGEMKWTKVKARNLRAYRDFASCYFVHAHDDMAHFHSIVIDAAGLNHNRYNAGNREIGFNKFIYQLLLKFCRSYKGSTFHAHLDHRTTRHPLDDLRAILNHGARKTCQRHDAPFKTVQFRHSHDEVLLQAADMLCGAVAYRWNEQHLRPAATAAKIEMADHVRELARLRDLAAGTPYRAQRFTIWPFKLRDR